MMSMSRSLLMTIALLACFPAMAAPLPPVDLDAFDASMKIAQLPNGVSLAYTERGPHDGIPVVMLHGFTNNARNWAPLIPYLDPRFHLILIDARGHGRSSRPECCYTRIDMAYDVKLLLDQLKIPAAHVIGHSMGSIVAQAFAETWPALTRKVVLIGSTGGSRPDCERGSKPTSPVSWMVPQLERLKDPIDPNGAFMNQWYGDAGSKLDDPDLLQRQRRDAAAIPVRVWLAVIRQGNMGAELQSALARFHAPALLIWGARDELMTEPVRCALREALPQARVHVFPDYGHNPFWDDAAAVAAQINPFLLQ